VLVTHEGGAAFMADAVSRASDTVGVLMVVPAAGLTHAMSGIGEAFLDGVPMLVVSGGVRTDMAQGFQLHDVDQQALMRTLTKATFKIERYEDVVPTVHRAYCTAVGGEPGPVYIELPANLQLFTGEVDEVPPFDGAVDRPLLDTAAVAAAVKLLAEAERPGIFVGWGARHVTADIRRLAEHLGAPVATTLQGSGGFSGRPPAAYRYGFRTLFGAGCAERVSPLRRHAGRRHPLRRDLHGQLRCGATGEAGARRHQSAGDRPQPSHPGSDCRRRP